MILVVEILPMLYAKIYQNAFEFKFVVEMYMWVILKQCRM